MLRSLEIRVRTNAGEWKTAFPSKPIHLAG